MNLQTMRRFITVNEYHQMGETGIFKEDEHLELIDGEIINMTPIGFRHASCVDRLNELFVTHLSGKAIVRVQNPVYLNEYSELEPDIAITKRYEKAYITKHPEPKDIYLIVEVADTSINFDREVKVPLYAKAGIIEVWLVDLNENSIEIYQKPVNEKYCAICKKYGAEIVSPLSFPDYKITINKLLC